MFQFPVAFRFPHDVIDILLVAFLVYRILLLIKGTRAFQVLLGLILLVAAYLASRWFELVALNYLLREFLSSFIILVVVLFQSDIRRALAQMGKQRFFGLASDEGTNLDAVEELVGAASALAREKTGALMIVERSTKVGEHVAGGVPMGARLGREILQSIFQTGSPIHDGAVIIESGKLALAGCFLPLTSRTDIDKDLGTRHRAAMGITEETDAVAIVVSEERGGISVVVNGRITRDLDSVALRRVLNNLLEGKKRKPKKTRALPVKEGEP